MSRYISVPCPTCRAQPGHPCLTGLGGLAANPHKPRIVEAKRAAESERLKP